MLSATGMAGHTTVIDFLGGMIREDENLGLIAGAGDVVCARTVASFASLAGWPAFCIESRFPVGSFLKRIVDLFVADLAGVRTNIGGRLSRTLC